MINLKSSLRESLMTKFLEVEERQRAPEGEDEVPKVEECQRAPEGEAERKEEEKEEFETRVFSSCGSYVLKEGN